MRRQSTRHRSRRADAGYTLIDMLFVVALIGVITSMALPGLMRARGKAQEASALSDLRLINSAQLSYAITCGSGFYAPDLLTLGALPPGSDAPFLPENLTGAASIMRFGYEINMEGTPHPSAPPSCNGLGMGGGATAYRAGADSLHQTAMRFFATNANGVIWQDTNSLYGTMPEFGESPFGIPAE